jgi:hypothetical protein
MVTTREVQNSFSAVNVELHSTLSSHITQVISKCYRKISLRPLLFSYVPEEAEELEIFECPRGPELLAKFCLSTTNPLPSAP